MEENNANQSIFGVISMLIVIIFLCLYVDSFRGALQSVFNNNRIIGPVVLICFIIILAKVFKMIEEKKKEETSEKKEETPSSSLSDQKIPEQKPKEISEKKNNYHTHGSLVYWSKPRKTKFKIPEKKTYHFHIENYWTKKNKFLEKKEQYIQSEEKKVEQPVKIKEEHVKETDITKLQHFGKKLEQKNKYRYPFLSQYPWNHWNQKPSLKKQRQNQSNHPEKRRELHITNYWSQPVKFDEQKFPFLRNSYLLKQKQRQKNNSDSKANFQR